MSIINALAKRPLPSFDQWLTDQGNGHRGAGFEAFKDMAERTHAAAPDTFPTLAPNEQAFLRMWLGMQIAVVELCNIEHQHGRTPAQIIQWLPRVLASAAMYATASVVNETTPMRTAAKILIEEFRFGAKESADQIEASR